MISTIGTNYCSGRELIIKCVVRFGRGRKGDLLGLDLIPGDVRPLPGLEEYLVLEIMLLTILSEHRVGNRIFLFGGTSPYHGPPLYFTPEQLALLPHQEEDQTSKVTTKCPT